MAPGRPRPQAATYPAGPARPKFPTGFAGGSALRIQLCGARGMFGRVGDRGQELLLVGAAGFVGSAIVTFIQPSKWSFGIRWVDDMCCAGLVAGCAVGTGPCVRFSHMMLSTCHPLGASLARSARTAHPPPEDISALVSCAIILKGEGDLYPLLCNSLAESWHGPHGLSFLGLSHPRCTGLSSPHCSPPPPRSPCMILLV